VYEDVDYILLAHSEVQRQLGGKFRIHKRNGIYLPDERLSACQGLISGC
jgi:hypothetical protein